MTLTLVSIFTAVLSFSLLGLQIVVAAVAGARWQALRQYARRSGVVALVVVGLGVPATVVTVLHLDLTAAAPNAPAIVTEIVGVATRLALLVGVFLQIAFVTLNMVVAIGIADRHPFPLLFGRAQRLSHLGYAALGGLAFGVGSAYLFSVLSVGRGSLIVLSEKMMPGVDTHAIAHLLGVTLPSFLGIAVAEEILFRGIMQRWLVKRLPATTIGTWGGIALTSFVWAIAHVANTDDVAFKVAQIFVSGLLLGWAANRFSVEVSIVGHAALNLGAILAVAVGRM